MTSVRLALLGALLAIAVALAVTLSRSPLSVAGGNSVRGQETQFASTDHGASYCQAGEVLPRGSTAIRVWLDAAAGPRVHLVVYSGARVIASGQRGSDWTGGSVTIPVRPLPRTVADATVCVSFALRDETILAQGIAAPDALAAHEGAKSLGGRLWIEYLRPGSRSWASLASQVIGHMGMGRAAGGDWVAYLALVLLATAAAVASRVLIRELR